MSARAGPEAAVEGLGAGADDYLVTPFSARELRARVDGRVALGRARREAERRFQAMADSTPALIWADGPGGQRLFVNRGWLEFTGAEPDADLGLAWQERIHPADRAHYDRVRATAAGGPFEVEYRLRAASGHYRWVLDRGAPAEGHVGGYVGGCLDIDSRVGERERQRLLAVVGAALDRETTVEGRRRMLVRTLVDEGLADMARFVEISDGQPTDGRAIAAHTPEQEALLHQLDADWMGAGATATGEVRRYEVDEAFILASSPDERQRELRRSVGFAHGRARPAQRPRPDLGAARGRPEPRLRPVRRRRPRAARRPRGTRGDGAGQRDAAGARAGQPGPAGGAAAGDRGAVRRGDPRAGRRGRGRAVRRAGPGAARWRCGGCTARATTRCSNAVLERRRRPGLPRHGAIAIADAGRPRRGRPHARARVGRARQRRRRLHPAGRRRHVRRRGRARRASPRRATGAARAALTVLAKLCAQALQRAGLLAAESAARRTAEEFGEVVGALSGATRLVDVAEVVLDHAVRLGASSAAVLLRVAEHLDVLAARGTDAVPAAARRLPMDAEHPAAHAARTGEPLWEGGGPDAPRAGRACRSCSAARPGPWAPSCCASRTGGRPSPRRSAPRCSRWPGSAPRRWTGPGCTRPSTTSPDVLQRSLLPAALPALPRLAVAARYLPSAVGVAAGGDWYDLLPIDEDRVAVVVGDVVGHGATAAAVMGQLRSALAAYLLDGHSPAAALERLDRFAAPGPGLAGSTCVCLVVDCATGSLCWASAGHPPVLLLEPEGPRYLDEGGGTVLGVDGRPPYRQAEAVIAPGSSVLLYTDGLVERRGEVLDEGQERLARAAAGVRDLAPDELVSTVVDAALADGALGDAAPARRHRRRRRPAAARTAARACCPRSRGSCG